MAKQLKSRAKFYTDAQTLLKKGLPVADLQDLAYEYEGITSEHVKEFVKSLNKTNAIKQQLEIDRKQAQQIYNQVDDLFIERYPHLIAMEQENNISYYNYNNGVYTQVSTVNLKDMIHDFFKEHNLLEHRTESKIKDTIGRIASILKYENNKRFNEKYFDTRKWYINVKNGLLDPITKELFSHTPEYFSITQTAFDYDSTASCPKFIQALDYTAQDAPGTAKMIQEMYGYILCTNGNPAHKVHYLFGRLARNGKGTFTNVLIGLIGESNSSKLSLEQMASPSDSVIVPIVGKHLNFSDEVNVSKNLDSGRLTSMSSQGSITISPKFEPAFSYKVRAKFIVACNYFPNFSSGQGMKHRTIIIPFNFHIAPENRVFDLDKILLEEEGSGILNWALEGHEMLKANNYQFYISEMSDELSDENNKGNDSVLAFLDEDYVFSSDYKKMITTKELYTGYTFYCLASGYSKKNFHNFSSTIKTFCDESKKIEYVRGLGRGYKYLMLKSDYDLPDDIKEDFEIPNSF